MSATPPNESNIKRQEISPGIVMEKYQEKTTYGNFYVIKIELQLFNVLDITIDFSNSRNLHIEGETTMIKKALLQPFTKSIIARLVLEKGWNLKTKFKFTLLLPSIEVQRQQLAIVLENLRKDIDRTKPLKEIDTVNIPDVDIFDFLKNKGWYFIDHDFLPDYSSIGFSEFDIIDKYECIVHWRRLKYIVLKAESVEKEIAVPYMFREKINPVDIKQGKLNNFWILSAFAALAEQPRLIERLFYTKKPNKFGLFKIKLCRMSKWKAFTVDDFFPCFPMGEPIFSCNQNKEEMWVMILEKAFAKMFGGYSKLVLGDVRDALIDMTGCPSFTETLNDEKMLSNSEKDQLWNEIKESLSKKYIVVSGTKMFKAETSNTGLIKEHAYSILRVADVEGHKIINLRNPWGLFDWEGEWSVNSPLWKETIVNEVKPNLSGEDNAFWMSWRNFLENFETVTTCKTTGWHELRVKGKFVTTIDENNDKFMHFCSRWYYQIELKHSSNVIIGLHQEDERYSGVKETRPYIDLGVLIATYKDGIYRFVANLDTDMKRQNYLEINLEPGLYYVIPRSLGVCLHFPNPQGIDIYDFSRYNPIVVSAIRDIFEKYDINSSEFLSYKELRVFYNFLEKTLTEEDYIAIVEKFGKRDVRTGELEGLSETGFINLFFFVIENKGRDYAVKIFRNLGYDEKLFSYRSRVFMMTVHSEEPINVTIKESLKENIDFVANKLLIRKFGKLVESADSQQAENSEISAHFYFNE
jgi:calpain-15